MLTDFAAVSLVCQVAINGCTRRETVTGRGWFWRAAGGLGGDASGTGHVRARSQGARGGGSARRGQ